ncbi:type I Zorya anti-phage system protein ZorC [Aeromonas veronii]|uniref:type I Zorya anti-phage system protein ZorC n=1 Tax=Aeromonas veronii TaxID=654 RepID=UPI0036704336
MVDAISRFTATLESSVERVKEHYLERPLHSFAALKQASAEVEASFDQTDAAPEPPKEKRHAALAAFLRNEPLTRRQWRLVYAGLVDSVEAGKQLLDDERVFPRVGRHVRAHIDNSGLARRDWLALCFSYFGYQAIDPEKSQNWQQLRTYIRDGYRVLRNPAKLKAWMRIVDEHQDLFQSEAGLQLGQQIFEGTVTDLTQLQTLAQIPAESWLWHQVIAVVQKKITELDETRFLARLPELLTLMGVNNRRHADEILAACLTRYRDCHCHAQPQPHLMQAGLEIWGNPQLKSEQNRWRHHVGKPVCDMVGAWLAKQDLQHFFSLLKGEGEVDQARLFYWLRFADQMSYTRIVMGQDARENKNEDFVQFRKENMGRFGSLMKEAGTKPADNAVIMQIGDYIFVEFSHTGNACYVYRADSCGFNPDASTLYLTRDLKQKKLAKGRWIHVPKPLKPNAMDGWQQKYDDELRLLGIVPTSQGASQSWSQVVKPTAQSNQTSSTKSEPKRQSYNVPERQTAASNSVYSDSKGKRDFTLLLEQLGDNLLRYVDNSNKYGTFHIELRERHERHEWLLKSCNFIADKNKPLMFSTVIQDNESTSTPQAVVSIKDDFSLLLEQLGGNLRHYTDHRAKGGAFHIEIKQRNTDDILLLRRNGFVVKNGSPFMFWKK